MKMLSKVVNLKRHVSHQSDVQNSLDSVSDSKLIVKQSTEISLAQTNQGKSAQGEMVKWSPSMQSLLDEPPSNLPLQLILGGVIFCISFALWAWFGEIDKVGKAQGKLVPEGETYKIESIESAKVSQIAVEEGQEVAAGDLIARLDSEQQIREVERLTNLLESYRQELNQKRYLLEKVEVESKTHRLIAQAEVRSQRSAIESAIAESEMTSELLEQRQSELQAYAARKQKVQDLSALEQDKLNQMNLELEEHRLRLARLKPLAEEGAISQEAIFQAQQAHRQSQQQLTDNKLQGISDISEQIFRSEQALREMEARITESQGDLVSGKKKIEQLEAELEHKTAERRRIELEAQQKVEQLKLETAQTQTKIAETQNKLAAATSLLEKRSLRAPVGGVVLSFNVVNTGKVVQSGETVAEIAPQNSPLVLSAILPDSEAGFVEKGMPVQVKFDAYSYQDYGVIPGKVISVSSDRKADEKLGDGYRIKIELERNYVVEEKQKIWFKPGQTATADVVIRRQRIIDVLLDPIKKLQQDGIEL
ncbi:MAG: HlyD family efflux transporter periplasmic adaptor subunit [Cyanobacteria bacterium P01_G01_bin.67]